MRAIKQGATIGPWFISSREAKFITVLSTEPAPLIKHLLHSIFSKPENFYYLSDLASIWSSRESHTSTETIPNSAIKRWIFLQKSWWAAWILGLLAFFEELLRQAFHSALEVFLDNCNTPALFSKIYMLWKCFLRDHGGPVQVRAEDDPGREHNLIYFARLMWPQFQYSWEYKPQVKSNKLIVQ